MAQQALAQGSEVVVLVAALNVREGPSLSADRVAQVAYGIRGWVRSASPSWADGYWWWHVYFLDGMGVEGWVAEGDADLAYLGDASDRSVVESIDPFGNTGEWSHGHFAAALELGLLVQCIRGDGRNFSADTFMGAAFPTEGCSSEDGLSFPRFDDPDVWDLEKPAIRLMGNYQVGGVRVYFASWSFAAIRGTGSFSYVSVYVQESGEVPELAFTIGTQGESYDPARPAEIAASIKLHLPGDSNCCPSFFVEQVFRADETGLWLVERNTVLNENGELARAMAAAAKASQSEPDPASVSSILTEVASIALDTQLSAEMQEQRYRQLQSRWDAELVATALRIMPVYDAESERWRSFDGWARDLASDTGVDAPFARDPVGSTVRMLFDPSFGTIGGELGLPNVLGW